MKLTQQQRATILKAIQHRCHSFPRTTLINKLESADVAIQLGTRRSAAGEQGGNNQADSYSRFQELDNALVREVAESYTSYLVNVYLSKSKVFSMTSTESQRATASAFNTIMYDQDRQTSWKSNLTRFFSDCASYNLGCIDVIWATKSIYNSILDTTKSSNQVSNATAIWKGNKLHRVDPYNMVFDTRVLPTEVPELGEFAGYFELYSQIRLFALIAELKADSKATVYDLAPPGAPRNWSVYTVTSAAAMSYNMEYKESSVVPLGSEHSQIKQELTGWEDTTQLAGLDGVTPVRSDYTVATFYLRVVPEVYGIKAPSQVELWKFWVLDGNYILASKKLEDAHSLIPMIFGQLDCASLGINTAGPVQAAIPYQKTAKQLMDRVLAGADKTIRDRAIYDSRYISEDAVNSSVPDAKIAVTTTLPTGKSIRDVYYSVESRGDTTGLAQQAEQTYLQGMRAAGVNNSQAGQFTKGNRTLEEYNDVQANAVSRQFIRALFIEATAMTHIKRIIKLNILQYQEAARLYDPESKEVTQVDKSLLYSGETEFAVADGLMPTEYMLSPNVQQQLFATVQAAPQAFAAYDIGKVLVHVLEHSAGINLSQYEIKQQQGTPT